MSTRLLRPALVPVVGVAILPLLAPCFSLAAMPIPIGPSTINPPRPMAGIEFVQEAGVERWEVKLTRGGSPETMYLQISGSGCTHMGEIFQGMITPLYDDMTFKTKSGRTCTVQSIER